MDAVMVRCMEWIEMYDVGIAGAVCVCVCVCVCKDGQIVEK